jgi:hypothetical protein
VLAVDQDEAEVVHGVQADKVDSLVGEWFQNLEMMGREVLMMNMSKTKRMAPLFIEDGSDPMATDVEAGEILPVDKVKKVGLLANNFEPGAPLSPILVRDQKRKKTEEEKGTRHVSKNGALAGSLEGCRQSQ